MQEVKFTADALAEKYGAVLSTENLAEVLGVKKTTIQQAISRETFQIPVAKIGGKWVALAYDVAVYLSNARVVFNAA